jgi:hypothetical protein
MGNKSSTVERPKPKAVTLKVMKAKTKTITNAYTFSVTQSIFLRLSLPVAIPKLSRNYSLRS